MTTRTGCTQTLLSSDYIFFFHQRNRVFDCLLFGQAALVFSEFIFNRMRPKKKKEDCFTRRFHLRIRAPQSSRSCCPPHSRASRAIAPVLPHIQACLRRKDWKDRVKFVKVIHVGGCPRGQYFKLSIRSILDPVLRQLEQD